MTSEIYHPIGEGVHQVVDKTKGVRKSEKKIKLHCFPLIGRLFLTRFSIGDTTQKNQIFPLSIIKFKKNSWCIVLRFRGKIGP